MSPIEEQLFRVVSATESVKVTAVLVGTLAVFVVLVLGFTAGHILDVIQPS